MKLFVALSVLLAAACAIPIEDYHHYSTTPIPIVKYDSQQNHDGSYNYAFESANGIVSHEQGYVKNAGVKDGEIQVAEGYYSYTSPEGHPISLQYIADENGFQVKGDHLPQPVPQTPEVAAVWEKVLQQQHQQQQQQHYEPEHQQQYYSKNY